MPSLILIMEEHSTRVEKNKHTASSDRCETDQPSKRWAWLLSEGESHILRRHITCEKPCKQFRSQLIRKAPPIWRVVLGLFPVVAAVRCVKLADISPSGHWCWDCSWGRAPVMQ